MPVHLPGADDVLENILKWLTTSQKKKSPTLCDLYFNVFCLKSASGNSLGVFDLDD